VSIESAPSSTGSPATSLTATLPPMRAPRLQDDDLGVGPLLRDLQRRCEARDTPTHDDDAHPPA
jgi:hypothetical protein